MGFLGDLFQYNYLRNALFVCVLSGVACGIVGTYIVTRRMVFLSGGITHSSFGGLGIALYAGVNPILGALIFAVLAAFGIEWASEKGKIRTDSAIGIVWSVGMAVGIIFMNLRPGYSSADLSSYLFGSIITVTSADVWSLLGVSLLLIGGAVLWLRQIMYVAFDREYAASQGIPTRFISYLMAVVVAVVIVLSIRAMGIVLLISMLTMPAVIVNSVVHSYSRIAIWSTIIAVSVNILGLFVSYNLDVPPSTAIIFLLTFTLIVVKLLPLHGKKRVCKCSNNC